MQEVQSNLRGHRSGRAYLIALLEGAKSEFTSDGHISTSIQLRIFSAFCFLDYLFARACSSPDTDMEDSPSEKILDTQTDKQCLDLVALIDSRLERLRAFEEFAPTRDKLALDAEARSFSLPSADATDKLLRYEAHLDRQLYRAMAQLERLQRQRRGENVPPRLNVNLGRRT